jgi:hypothetical protein
MEWRAICNGLRNKAQPAEHKVLWLFCIACPWHTVHMHGCISKIRGVEHLELILQALLQSHKWARDNCTLHLLMGWRGFQRAAHPPWVGLATPVPHGGVFVANDCVSVVSVSAQLLFSSAAVWYKGN